jgi:hypothetical protein
MQSEDEDDYVRPPDEPIREILVNSNNNTFASNTFANTFNDTFVDTFEEDMQKCLKESELTFAEEEQKHFETIQKQQKERSQKCESIVKKITKVKAFDIKNKEIYETICTIIELWEMEYIMRFEIDKPSYDSIFKIIKTIRLTNEEHQFLVELIVLIPE